MRIHALIPSWALLTLLNKFTELRAVETARPALVLGVVVEHTVFVVVGHPKRAGDAFEEIKIKMLNQ